MFGSFRVVRGYPRPSLTALRIAYKRVAFAQNRTFAAAAGHDHGPSWKVQQGHYRIMADPRSWPIRGIKPHGGRTEGYHGPPVYGPDGRNLNDDKQFKAQPVPACSITGKPRRQLGHFPFLGRRIVPYARRDFFTIFDNMITPQPWMDEWDMTFWQIIRGLSILCAMIYFFYLLGYYSIWYPRRNTWHWHPGFRDMLPFYVDIYKHKDLNPVAWIRPNNPFDKPRIINKCDLGQDHQWEYCYRRYMDEFIPVLGKETRCYGVQVYGYQRGGYKRRGIPQEINPETGFLRQEHFKDYEFMDRKIQDW